MNKLMEIKEKELKEIELRILEKVHEICVDNKIKYFLAYGTLLGAVRHKGFIPWDDDIDICMLRDDYEKFLKIMKKNSAINNANNIELISFEMNDGYPYTFAKIYDSRTSLNETLVIEKIKNTYNLGVYIDVFPLDGVNNSFKCIIKLFFIRILEYFRLFKILDIKKLKLNKFCKVAIKCINFVVPSHKRLVILIDKLVKRVNYSTQVGFLSTRKKQKLISKDCFLESDMLSFEGKMFICPKKYDEVLKGEYGDYMELPKEELRKSHHDFNAYWRCGEGKII